MPWAFGRDPVARGGEISELGSDVRLTPLLSVFEPSRGGIGIPGRNAQH